MGTALLASPQELGYTPAEELTFEMNRRSTSHEVVEVVNNQFVLRDVDWGGLFSYLLRHPEAVPVLLEAPKAVHKVFGAVRPMLDLVTDPEDEWEELFIVVPTEEPVAKALERLKRLDVTWFAEASRRARFAINVTIEQRV